MTNDFIKWEYDIISYFHEFINEDSNLIDKIDWFVSNCYNFFSL